MTVEQLAITLTADIESITAARHFVRAALRTLDAQVDADIAELLTSELTANAVALAAGDMAITVWCRRQRLRVEVQDYGYGRRTVAERATFGQTGGRGLMIVDGLADAWGIDDLLPGKIVWFELAPEPDPL